MSEKMDVWQYTRELTFPARLAGRSAGEVKTRIKFFRKIFMECDISERQSAALALDATACRRLMEGGNGESVANGITQFAEGEPNAAQCSCQNDEAENLLWM